MLSVLTVLLMVLAVVACFGGSGSSSVGCGDVTAGAASAFPPHNAQRGVGDEGDGPLRRDSMSASLAFRQPCVDQSTDGRSPQLFTARHRSPQLFTDRHRSPQFFTDLHRSSQIVTDLHSSSQISTALLRSPLKIEEKTTTKTKTSGHT